MRIALRCAFVVVLGVSALREAAAAVSAMDTVHAFCRADGRGERILVRTWPTFAPLIQWGLEPAWDHVVLIDSYEVSDPRYDDAEHAVVTVTYHVAADVEAGHVTREPREETRVFRLVADESRTWRIVGPPPAPHVFLSQVEPDAMAASLEPTTGDFLSSAAFVQHFLDGAGWDLTSFAVSGTPTLGELTDVTTPAIGDIVLYYDGDAPYHIGVLESEDVVLSATLNGGIRRAPVDAFAGKVRYRRPRASARVTTPTGPASKAKGKPRTKGKQKPATRTR